MRNKEVIIIRGIGATVQAMNYPTLEAVNSTIAIAGYMLLDMSKFTFTSFKKDYKTYKEAYDNASIKIMIENLKVEIEECITITHK